MHATQSQSHPASTTPLFCQKLWANIGKRKSTCFLDLEMRHIGKKVPLHPHTFAHAHASNRFGEICIYICVYVCVCRYMHPTCLHTMWSAGCWYATHDLGFMRWKIIWRMSCRHCMRLHFIKTNTDEHMRGFYYVDNECRKLLETLPAKPW